MSLNPQARKLASGKIELTWTPDPTAFGYRFYRDGQPVSKSTNPAQHTTTFAAENDGQPHWYGVALALTQAAESVQFPAVVPPSGQFGAKLYEGFEWSQQAPGGKVATVHTAQELATALASGADIIDGAGLTFSPGQVSLPSHSGFRVLRNINFERSRVYKTNTSKWSLQYLSSLFGLPEDDVKGSGGGFLHLFHCNVGHAPRQGMLLYPHDDVIAEYTRFHHNGSAVDNNLDHGVYTGEGRRYLGIHNTHDQNFAYAIQHYPQYHGARNVQCTYYGGTSRGGPVFGSENPVGSNAATSTSDIRFIGCISANSASYGWTQYQEALRCTIEYCVGWNNRQGDYTLGFQPVGFVHGDPKFVDPANGDFRISPGSAALNMIPQSLWPYVTSPHAGAGVPA